MTKFLVKKKLMLEFVGDEWKDCYMEFTPFTAVEVKEKFPELLAMQTGDPKVVLEGMDTIISVLSSKFVSGKGIDENGKEVAITKKDIPYLPIEVLGRSLSFLSQGNTISM
jgi:hypothetical protein